MITYKKFIQTPQGSLKPQRGSPIRKLQGDSNKKDCPPEGVPLWVVLDPLLWGRQLEERQKVIEEIAANYDALDGKTILKTESGQPYVIFAPRNCGENQLTRLRKILYRLLPAEVTQDLPEEIKNKYSPRPKESPLETR